MADHNDPVTTPEDRKLAHRFYVKAADGIATDWIEGREPFDSDEIDDDVRDLAVMLSSVRRSTEEATRRAVEALESQIAHVETDRNVLALSLKDADAALDVRLRKIAGLESALAAERAIAKALIALLREAGWHIRHRAKKDFHDCWECVERDPDGTIDGRIDAALAAGEA